MRNLGGTTAFYGRPMRIVLLHPFYCPQRLFERANAPETAAETSIIYFHIHGGNVHGMDGT